MGSLMPAPPQKATREVAPLLRQYRNRRPIAEGSQRSASLVGQAWPGQPEQQP
ncbi:MAG: hypothetical protein ACK559_37695 [bacterium]